MGAKTSKRSVDITTTPKKGEGDVPGLEGEGKVEKIGDLEEKVTSNGGLHAEIEYADKEETEKDQTEPNKDEVQPEPEPEKVPEKVPETPETVDEEKSPEPEKAEEAAAAAPTDSAKKTKEKSKKKKWSFRSISFSKKEKTPKPEKELAEKTEEVKETAEEEEKPSECPAPVEQPKTEAEPATAEATPSTGTDEITKTEECKLPAAPPTEPVVEKQPEPVVVEVAPVVDTKTEVEQPKEAVEQPKEPVEQPKVVVEQPNTVVAEQPKTVPEETPPPPLPASNPPSPVTVFAESTMAEPVVASPVKQPEEPVAQSSPIIESKEAPPSPVTEQILNADSLPDISTESLPSLPEPVSESLPEPMSLPPVECVPEPIANDKDHETEVVLTNGDTNGLPPSPIHNGTNGEADVTLPTIEIDRPIVKQVPPSETITQNDRQDVGDKQENIEQTPVKVEE